MAKDFQMEHNSTWPNPRWDHMKVSFRAAKDTVSRAHRQQNAQSAKDRVSGAHREPILWGKTLPATLQTAGLFPEPAA